MISMLFTLVAAAGGVATALLMCWERQLPIYCEQKDYKVLSISFGAA